ncbi:LacI family DNA-binding transcriptional regulator [Brachybacterium timonense]|uniref:LacI family DNA-binding transcriptional regulator n=1 Tax=Brachybacterium timonense TaxID=2050896 RepID=UPI000D0B199A|nr:LacI family DNA-binding transcriptional regulator [Brachybacterium timonense]
MTETPARAAGRRPVTLRDVADAAGVSIKTVSNVVNDRPNVGPATRERVQQIIRELNYRPQVGARQLRTGTSGLITLAIPSLAGSYFSELAQAFAQEAQRRRHSIMLHTTVGGAEEERSVLSGFTRVIGDGVIFSPIAIGEDTLAAMDRTIQPTVFIGEHVPEQALPAGSDYVHTDNVQAAADATAHLAQRGSRRIAYVGALTVAEAAQEHSTSRLRVAGYRQALAERGLGPPVVQAVETWTLEGGAAAVPPLLANCPDVDGIVCGNDEIARGVMLALRTRGLEVPQQVRVIGYDDTRESRYTTPTLSSIDPQREQLVGTVLDMLIERIQGYDGPPRRVIAPHRLMARASS